MSKSQTVSFRLSLEEIKLLKEHGELREAPSQTAQRLIRNFLGTGNVPMSQLEKLTSDFEQLEQRVKSLELEFWSVSPIPPRSAPKSTTVVADPPSKKGITQNKLCNKFNISPSNVGRKASARYITIQEYLEQETGWKKIGKLWYEPSD